ncbi:MAG: succinate dehydrogenase [Deltaproteobacteria bacterium]|nr:succinate dehydrogenase [Deltaproteobacteria bacterium]
MELIELFTGLFLLVFLQFHMLAVATIILGPAAFNRDALMLDEYYLSYIGIPLVILAIIVHGLVALRKAPWRYKEMAIFIQHSRRLAHLDTWAWFVQIITGMAVLILAAIHIWNTLSTWPIEAAKSAFRIQSGSFSNLFLLLLIAEIHAMVGLYRILVKWSWIHRQKFTKWLVYATIGFVALGFIALVVFYFLDVKGLT